MKIKEKNIKIPILSEEIKVSLKWYRGASHYNNGASIYGKKYSLRLLLSRSKVLMTFTKNKLLSLTLPGR